MKNFRIFLISFVFMSCFAGTGFASAKTVSFEEAKIKNILALIEGSDAEFIRNGSSYTAKEARSHMEYKLSWAGDKIKTADQFVEYIASKSSSTGEPYYVKFKDGSSEPTQSWIKRIFSRTVTSKAE